MEYNNENIKTNDTKFNVSSSGKKSLLSIIVPIYNGEKYLAQCLDSILNQEFSDFEVLCVNDGSTDKSGQILDEYARKDQRIKAFHIANHGVSYARNYALTKSFGSFIGFVDSDDWIDPDHYSILMKFFDDPNVDMVVCKVVNEETDAIYKSCHRKCLRETTFEEFTRTDTINGILKGDIFGYCPNKVFKKEKIKSLFNEKITFIEDKLFCCQYVYDIEKSICANCETYHYRHSAFGSSWTDWLFKNLGRISGLKALILVVDLLSQDAKLNRNRDETIEELFNWYFALYSHYKKERNKVALDALKGYSKELRELLRIFWSSSYYNLIDKIKSTFKVRLPLLWSVIRCFHKN